MKTYEYYNGDIRIQTSEQGKHMMGYEWDMNILGITIEQYS